MKLNLKGARSRASLEQAISSLALMPSERHAHSRRNIELVLLILAAIPVLLLYALLTLSTTETLSLVNFTIPLGLLGAFTVAHLALRRYAPAADAALLPIVFLLSGIGITFLTRLSAEAAFNQVIWLFLSVAALIGVLVVIKNLEMLARYKYTLGIIGLALLILPMLIGTEHFGSKLWISIGSFSFQPGEFAKILIILFLAFYLAANRETLSASMMTVGPLKIPRPRMLMPILLMWGLSILVVIFEKDLGSALLFFIFFVVMLYVATGQGSYVFISLIMLLAGGYLCYRLFGHVQTRVNIWLDPWSAAESGGYQIVQTMFSLADGGLIGTGITKGLAHVIPVVKSDFIFAVIGEELGLIGGSAVLILYIMLAIRGFATAARAKSDAASFVACGLTVGISFQAFLIVAGVTKLLPLTGVTLPFMSQGGTSLLASFILIGLLLRAGDEGTGRSTLIESLDAEVQRKTADPLLTVIGSRLKPLSSGIMNRLDAPLAQARHVRARFTPQTAESGVLGRVALSRRLTNLVAVFSFLFALLIANLTYIQQIDAKRIQNLPNNGHTIARWAYVQRGPIMTSDGVTLAESTPTADGSFTRTYPQGDLARHVVGYLSTQYGSTGLEASMNDTLTGREDYSNWKGVLQSIAGIKHPGSGVTTTINSQIQRAAQNALEGYVGAVVVLDPKTGAVLAKASAPTYTVDKLEDILTSTKGELLDRTTQTLYAPGSTFKAITLATALETKTTTLNATISAAPKMTFGTGEVTNYHGNDYGTPTVKDAFALSSNTAFAQLGTKIGAAQLVKAAQTAGFGRPLGQDFSCMASLMPNPQEMTEWELAWAACGQPVGQHASPAGPQLTIMQNAVIAQAIANGGVAMDPYVVRHILSSEGTTTHTTQPRTLGSIMSADTAAQMKEAMLAVVKYGTGKRAQIQGTQVAGKTGTAEIGDGQINSFFIGFAPFDTPTLAISVCIEGKGDNVEGLAAAIAGKVLATALNIQASGAGK